MTEAQGVEVLALLGALLDVCRAGYVVLCALVVFAVIGAVRWR